MVDFRVSEAQQTSTASVKLKGKENHIGKLKNDSHADSRNTWEFKKM